MILLQDQLPRCLDGNSNQSRNANQIKIEDLPPKILNDEHIWKEEDPQTSKWEKSVIDYFNNIRAFTHLPMIVLPTDPRRNSVFDPSQDDEPFDKNPLAFTIEIRDFAKPN
ncbi:hypothetical protein Hanom_Chr08g00713411 [Helianthus anomalus]